MTLLEKVSAPQETNVPVPKALLTELHSTSRAGHKPLCEASATKAIDDLPERERLVMNLYYYEEMTMKEIGLILGVHESRVSQTHASAVLHLRARLSSAVTTEQPRGNVNHPNRANRESFRKRAGARKPKNSGYAEAIGCR
jgi:hypothetical protein